jgi:hypothetical protein
MKRPAKKRSNNTLHKRTLADAQVKSKINDLRGHWAALDLVERGDRLRELADLGCSTRGLAQALRQSATSIRRHMQLSKLPKTDRTAVKGGKSAKRVLANKQREDRARRSMERVLEDQKTGKFSDEMADLILEFCRAKEGIPETPVLPSNVHALLSSTRQHLETFKRLGRRRLHLSKMLSRKILFRSARPKRKGDQFWLEERAEWLAEIIWSRIPEKMIQERALEQVKKRTSELEEKLTIAESRKRRLERLNWISSGPGRRNY